MKFINLTAVAVLMTPALNHCASAASFGEDADFLKRHTDLIVLGDQTGRAKVAVAPAWQGRVMTSTATGDAGSSFGFLNRHLIAAGVIQPHINVFGGEDRFWLGPEGGQFSIFFARGAKFDLEHWYTPAPIDTMPYRVISRSAESVKFGAEFALTNFSGARFELKVEREVRLLTTEGAWKTLGVAPSPSLSQPMRQGGQGSGEGGVDLVAYETDNRIINAGQEAWRKETGLLSIWILGMFKHSPATTVVVPIKPGPESELGVKVTSDYFGAIPPERLKVKEGVIYFSGDGRFRSKIGINPRRSKAVLGSYDAESKVLTIVQFTQPPAVTDYVNSLWKLQENPYGGDAANSYNDGPPAPGASPLGPFYELESSSPAAALAPGQSLAHVHRTIHLSGPRTALDAAARAALGVSLADIESGLK